MKITPIAAATIIAATSAHADTYWYCKGDECVGRLSSVSAYETDWAG
jgi:hypothetical protein